RSSLGSPRRHLIFPYTTLFRSQPAQQPFGAKDDQTSIFIFPPYRWKHVQAMVTNFHLPRSTLIAMIAAFVGLEEQRRIYRVAIEDRKSTRLNSSHQIISYAVFC